MITLVYLELFPDLEENDRCYVRMIKKHLSVGSVQVALYIRCNWL